MKGVLFHEKRASGIETKDIYKNFKFQITKIYGEFSLMIFKMFMFKFSIIYFITKKSN
jgi:hypothetical protein